MKIPSVMLLVKSLLIVIGVEVVGSIAVTTSISSWYAHLVKPAFVPPGFVFSIAWGILYLLIGVSLYLILLQKKSQEKHVALRVFALQLGLNLLWSIVFFGLRLPYAGLMVIFLLCAMLVWNMVLFYQLSKNASYLLVPYLAWILFATYLNWGIMILNR